MTTALWMILPAALLPYFWVILAKAGPGYDNHRPREILAGLDGWRKRANWAQLNAFEAFPAFAAAVLIAHMVAGPTARADTLAIGFVAFRVLHGILYLLDRASLRSLAWVGGFACVIGLFLVAAGVWK